MLFFEFTQHFFFKFKLFTGLGLFFILTRTLSSTLRSRCCFDRYTLWNLSDLSLCYFVNELISAVLWLAYENFINGSFQFFLRNLTSKLGVWTISLCCRPFLWRTVPLGKIEHLLTFSETDKQTINERDQIYVVCIIAVIYAEEVENLFTLLFCFFHLHCHKISLIPINFLFI